VGTGVLTHKVADPAALTRMLFDYWHTKGFDMGRSASELNELKLIFDQHVKGETPPAIPEFEEDAPKLFGPTSKCLKLEKLRQMRDTLKRDLSACGWTVDELG
jgi:hypothetical protein